jgi:hypothetical protein
MENSNENPYLVDIETISFYIRQSRKKENKKERK